MARVLIVGCGCRGRELAAELTAAGHAVRGTTRREKALEAISATGAEAVLADPGQLATILPRIEGVSVVCWLVRGGPLETLLERLVDTPVRGFAYEGDRPDVVLAALDRWQVQVEGSEEDAGDHPGG